MATQRWKKQTTPKHHTRAMMMVFSMPAAADDVCEVRNSFPNQHHVHTKRWNTES